MPTFLSLYLFYLLAVQTGCSFADPDPKPDEPYFKPGEYGGDPLPGTEVLYNLSLSPDGNRIALVRSFTPNEPFDPRDQLWIVDRDGSDPQLVAVNIGTVDWSPDGRILAVTVALGIDFHIYTLDLQTNEMKQWTGRDDQYFSKPTVSNPIWFQDGERLLVSVTAKAYEQPFERGIYTINIRTGAITGPLVVLMDGAFLGNHDRYAMGRKFTFEHDRRDGNAVIYDFATERWQWITSFPYDSLDYIEPGVVPNPENEQIVQSRLVENAWQLFFLQKDGAIIQQITRLGGDNPRWSYDGRTLFFRRDVHKGLGARYVPFVYDVEKGEDRPVWPDLPDSLPSFPALPTLP